AHREVVEHGVELLADERRGHLPDPPHAGRVLRGERGQHARAVHAEGGEGAEIGLDAGAAARVGARDGERDGAGGHAARPAPASGRGGRPYASRTLSPRSGQRAEGGRSSTSSPRSFTYSGAWPGCGA